MPIVGPIFPKNNSTENTLPFVNSFPLDFQSPIRPGEIASNIVDGRLWLRKQINYTRGFSGLYEYNFEQIGGPYVITEKTGGYTFQAEDTGRIIWMKNTSDAKLKIPSYTGGASSVDFVVGTHIMVIQGTTYSIGITGANGVTIDVKNGSYTFDQQNGFIQCLKIAQDRWLITGDRDTAGLASDSTILEIATDVVLLQTSLNTFLSNLATNGYGGATWA